MKSSAVSQSTHELSCLEGWLAARVLMAGPPGFFQILDWARGIYPKVRNADGLHKYQVVVWASASHALLRAAGPI